MSPALQITILQRMLRIRYLEWTAIKEYSTGEMGGFMISSVGQESIAATVRAAMSEDDHSISGCRGIGHALSAGIPMLSILAELMGRTGGCSKGKGGMFSFYSPERKHWGCHGLAAAQTPLANGLAFAMKLKSEPGAVVCFMGESAANQGVFHETLNLAALFDLPVIFVIENNGFGMFTSQERSSRFTECVARRAETYGIEWDICNDENIPVMHAKIATALQRARVESRPTVLEITTMRYYGWTISDANNWRYRKREIVEERKEHSDPMTLWKQHLIDQGTLSETEARQMGESAKAEAIDATKLAKLSPPQTMESILEDVYWESDHETPASKTGHHFFS